MIIQIGKLTRLSLSDNFLLVARMFGSSATPEVCLDPGLGWNGNSSLTAECSKLVTASITSAMAGDVKVELSPWSMMSPTMSRIFLLFTDWFACRRGKYSGTDYETFP